MFALSTRSPRSDLIYPNDLSVRNVVLCVRCAPVGIRECWALENNRFDSKPFTIGRYGNLPYVVVCGMETSHMEFLDGNLPYEVCRAVIPIRRIITYTIHLWQVWKPALRCL